MTRTLRLELVLIPLEQDKKFVFFNLDYNWGNGRRILRQVSYSIFYFGMPRTGACCLSLHYKDSFSEPSIIVDLDDATVTRGDCNQR